MTQTPDPNRTPDEWIPRKRTLTEADIEAIQEYMQCQHKCAFSPEEVQFVRDWLDNMKTVKSEIIKYIVKMIIYGVGIVCAVVVASKMGWFKLWGK